MATVPPRVVELIETFDRNIDAYKEQYNEAQLRREFIDPFFEELGWDVTNKGGLAQAYKDVIHEDAIKIGGYTKAPDYCFRIGGTRKFFLEAKKPSIDIKGDPNPAYQLRRYAWTSKLPLSILTDFEEFAVYDCQTRPKHTDKASAARVMYFTYKDYTQKWDEIADIFSKDAIQKGSFDKFAVSTKAKRGTTTVDTEFLAELEKWRADLARIIALRNTTLSAQEINFAVQRTIDRIIFLRMCEDRGIEPYGQLQAISSGDRTYPRLCELFEKADHKYNSGLFYFSKEPGRPEDPDELTLNLLVDDGPLKYILHSFYYPQCPYEFSVLPAEILGNVYEQFLGSVIQVSLGRRTKVEPKPEVKKAGGIYYTPAYIVDYIVKNTVDKLCEGKKPNQILKLKILDPACGSGSFLLSAYTCLLNHHRDWYVDNNPSKYRNKIYQGRGGQWFLTIAEKKRILLNNIFGVDIDSQAVEVTKLSLLLKVLEGETAETVGQTYKIFHERALPDLGNNIKCGNSLIGPDFYDNLDPSEITEELREKINAFDWKTEFPQIFSRKPPGFDAVIGNPPWIDIKGMNAYEVDYYFKGYSTTANRMNVYATFLHKSLILLNPDGLLGFTTPSSFYTQSSYKRLRTFLLDNASVSHIVRLPDKVFPGVTAESAITIFSKKSQENCEVVLFNSSSIISSINNNDAKSVRLINTKPWKQTKDRKFQIYISDNEQAVLRKLSKKATPLHNLCDFSLGLTPYDKYKGHSQKQIENKVFHSTFKKDDTFKPLLSGQSISRYILKWCRKNFISYGKWLGAPREPRFFNEPRIIVRQIISGRPGRIYAVCTDEEYYYTQVAFGIIPKQDSNLNVKFLTAIINSKLITFVHRIKFLDPLKTRFQKILIQDAKQLPIRTIDFNNPDDAAKYDKMVKLVERMLDLHKRLTKAKVPAEKTRIQRQINTTDSAIDKLTYQLYNLTEEEIKIVEENE